MLWYERFDQAILDELPDLSVAREEPLSRHSSFRIGGWRFPPLPTS